MLFSGCGKDEGFYAPNRDLISLLDSHDRKTVLADKYVLRGDSGHLFYLEDLRAAVVKWDSLDENIRLIQALSDTLKSLGVRLLIVPAPTKVETYPELLGGKSREKMSPSKNLFLERLAILGVEFLDLRGDFFRAKGEKRLFPRTDTHWDQEAIRIAAKAIAEWAQSGYPGSSGASVRDFAPSCVDTLLTGFQGDLAVKFRLHAARHSDTLALCMVADVSGNRFREPERFDLLLYGDSFLNQFKSHGAHLGAHVSRERGIPVRSVYSLAAFGNGPDKISGVLALHPQVKYVAWVFTSRTLMEASVAGR